MDDPKPPRPFWLPDTQGFLSVAIIFLIAIVVLILLTRPPAIDERTSGVLMTIVGVLIACLKDVYSFFFGSSKGSQDKSETISKITIPPTPTTTTQTTRGGDVTTTTEPTTETKA